MQMGIKDDANASVLFSIYSLGLVTNRDPWTYSYSRTAVENNMRRLIKTYSSEMERYERMCVGKAKEQRLDIGDVIDPDLKQISWTRALKADATKGKRHQFKASAIVPSMYRPFNRQWLYFSRAFNEMVNQTPKLFPTPEHANIAISCTGVADRKGFSVLATNQLPNMHLTDTGQCFPLYWYEKPKADPQAPQGEMAFETGETPDADGYIRRDAITDWALTAFRDRYQDQGISKEDLFYYVYGILHAPEYKQRFAADLKKMLPRIPFAGDFWAFSKAGRALADLHIHYEQIEPYPVQFAGGLSLSGLCSEDFRVEQMKFAKGKNGEKYDKTRVIYNHKITMTGIPLEAYQYIVNGKSALEWVMERQTVSQHKESGIVNDANLWAIETMKDAAYPLKLFARVITVSVKTMEIVNALPGL